MQSSTSEFMALISLFMKNAFDEIYAYSFDLLVNPTFFPQKLKEHFSQI